jgi:hypothetical protein
LGVYNMGAGNVEDPPMAVVLMILLQRMTSSEDEPWVHIDSVSVTTQIASFGLSVLPGRIAKLPIPVLSSLLFDCLEGIPKLEWSAWRVLRSGKRLVAGMC